MITAVDALRLPHAALKPTDAADAARLLERIDAHVREKMLRRGAVVAVPFGEVNPEIIAEVTLALRRRGWVCEWQQWLEKSALSRQMEQVGFQVAVSPTLEAYDEVDGVSVEVHINTAEAR